MAHGGAMGHERSSTTLDLYTRRTDDPTRILRALEGDDEEDEDGRGWCLRAGVMPFPLRASRKARSGLRDASL